MGQVISIAARRPLIHDVRRVEPEQVAELLLALESATDRRPSVFPLQDLAGAPMVAVRLGARGWRLTLDEARLAADALVADMAYPGCVGDAAALGAAAVGAESRQLRRGCGRVAR